MDEIKKVKSLRKYKNSKFPILSIYLGSADLRPPQVSYYLTQLHSLVHQNLNSNEKKIWQHDIDRIDTFFHESLNRSNVRSIVFFSAGRKLWKVLEFEFFLPPLIIILHSPYLKPIEDALGTYQKYLVLLVDREKARLFTVHLGEIEDRMDFFDGEVPQKVKVKKIDWGQFDKIPRHIEEHLHHHLQLINQTVKEYVKDRNINFIILGGHKELLPKIKSHLSNPLNKMVLGEFITELNISLNEILIHSKKIVAGVDAKKRIST